MIYHIILNEFDLQCYLNNEMWISIVDNNDTNGSVLFLTDTWMPKSKSLTSPLMTVISQKMWYNFIPDLLFILKILSSNRSQWCNKTICFTGASRGRQGKQPMNWVTGTRPTNKIGNAIYKRGAFCCIVCCGLLLITANT